jgi:uncharacterized protein YgiM (DUF1202 family)
MKLNCWLIFGAMLSSSVLAQQVTNAPPAAPIETPAPAPTLAAAPTNAPAAATTKKKSAAKKKAPTPAKKKDPAAELRTVPLVPGPAVVDANNVNVRGQPRLKSEIVTRLTKGQSVTVLEEIIRNNSAAAEPSAWAKILWPTNAHVWVSSQFINSDKMVSPTKLNLRSGPGENYSVIGQLQKGDIVKEISTKGTWTEIEAPATAYAFVAAQYLKQEAPAAAPPTIAAAQTNAPPETPATPTTVTEPPTVAAAPTETPAISTNAPTETPAVTNAPAETAATGPVTVTEEPPPKRIVQREGVVRGTVSIQAPSRFGLYSAENGRLIDYLHTTSPNLDLRRYKGIRIIVTGEEGLEERWGNTPVITIQKIQVLEE